MIKNADNITFTKLEFSDGTAPLTDEPNSDEAKYFNNTILESLVKITETTQLSYDR